MFNYPVLKTPFTSRNANTAFGTRIPEFSYCCDQSFSATVRALVGPRLRNGDGIVVSGRACYGVPSDIKKFLKLDQRSSLVICDLSWVPSGNTGVLETFLETVPQHPGWQLLQKVTDFYRRSFRAQCFINPELRSSVLVVERMDLQKFHYLQYSITDYLPWYFGADQCLSNLEAELVNSFREKQPDHYLSCLNRIAESYDFRAVGIQTALDAFENWKEREALISAKKLLEGTDSQIMELQERLRVLLQLRELHAARIRDAEQECGMKECELMEFFLNNPGLTLSSASDKQVRFYYKGFLTSFDQDRARSLIENRKSSLYYQGGRSMRRFIPAEDIRRLLTAVFLDQTVKLRMCAAFTMDITCAATGVTHCEFGQDFSDSMPNPGVQEFGRLGNYQTISNLMDREDFVGVVEQCIVACVSLDLEDAQVVRAFMRYLYGTDSNYARNRCFVMPDGTSATVQEAIEWLRDGN